MPAPTSQKAFAVLTLWASLLSAHPVWGASLQDRIVAVINTEVITLTELEEEVGDMKAQTRRRYNGAELTQRLRQIDYMGLNRMIERKLQVQIAKRRGIKVSDEEVKDAIVRLRRLGETPNENDPKELALIKDHLTALRLINQQVRSSLLVSDEEILRFYRQHQDRFLLPLEVRISQILIALGPGSELLAVREKAHEVHARLKKGERFEELAARYSDGPEGRRGGNLGYIRPGDMLPQIQQAIEQAPPGAVRTHRLADRHAHHPRGRPQAAAVPALRGGEGGRPEPGVPAQVGRSLRRVDQGAEGQELHRDPAVRRGRAFLVTNRRAVSIQQQPACLAIPAVLHPVEIATDVPEPHHAELEVLRQL